MPKLKYKCDYCSSDMWSYNVTAKRHFCNKTCKSEYQKTLTGDKNPLTGRPGKFGKDNPNYGNKWTPVQKEVASNRSKDWHQNDDGTWLEKNRNRVWTDEGKASLSQAMSLRMTGVSRPHTEERKALIGIKSAEKFTQAYNVKVRRTMEERGYWRPIDEIPEYELYFKKSDWCESMFNRASGDELKLLNEYKVFNNKTNRAGVVRDHKYGRSAGFANKVFPELLQHPCNCQIILHCDNTKKSRTKNSNDCVITLEQLFYDIKNYKGDWKYQQVCCDLIDKFNAGKRYNS